MFDELNLSIKEEKWLQPANPEVLSRTESQTDSTTWLNIVSFANVGKQRLKNCYTRGLGTL